MTIEINSGFAATGPVYICHGASDALSHTLTVAPHPDSPWTNQQVSCYDVVGEHAPAVRVIPAVGDYLTFEPTGAVFQLHCPADGTDADLRLRLRSEFTAELYEIALQLGDYRRKIVDSSAPARFPLLGTPVEAEITVGSFYTEKLLAGVEVEWRLDGRVIQTAPTTASGKSTVHIPAPSLGVHTITARVHSPYDDSTSAEVFEIKVLADSPWIDAKWVINEIEVPEGAPVFLPRGQSNTVKLVVPELDGTAISLNQINDEGLNIQAVPAFGAWVSLVEASAEWTLTQEELKSGHLTLVVLSREVEPTLERRCWVMANNLGDEVTLKFNDGEVPDVVEFVTGVPGKLTLVPKAGSPIDGESISLNWTSGTGVVKDEIQAEPDWGGANRLIISGT